MQFNAILMPSNFAKILTKTPHILPSRASYGVAFVNITSDASFVLDIVISYANNVMF